MPETDPVGDPAETMRTRLREDLIAAMKRRDAQETSVLRVLIAAIDNAQAVAMDAKRVPVGQVGSQWVAGASAFGTGEAQRRQLSHAEIEALVRGEAERLEALAEVLDGHNRRDDAQRARSESQIARRYARQP